MALTGCREDGLTASLLSSVQFEMVFNAQKSPYALHTPSLTSFPNVAFWNGSSVGLINDGPLSPFQGRSASASSFHASLLQAVDGVVTVALCPQGVFSRVKRLAPLYHLAVTEPHAGQWRSWLNEEAFLLYGLLLCGLSSDFGVLQIFSGKKIILS